LYDLAIIGGGPGGYAAALYAHNFGLSVALVEEDLIGGACLHRGCVPAKSWLRTAEVFTEVARSSEFGVVSSEPAVVWTDALERKKRVVAQLHRGLSGLLRNRKVDVFAGRGRLRVPGTIRVTTIDGAADRIEAEKIILATGSVPRSIPGYTIDGERVVSSDHALDWSVQPERVAIVGAGAVGCEFASFLSDLGSSVHLFEMLDQILPGIEPSAVSVLRRELARRRVQVHTGIGVGPAVVTEDGVVVPYGDESVVVDVVLTAVGRAPVTDDIGIEGTEVQVERGYVKVDPATMETAVPGVYAIGDIVADSPQLAHAAFAEAIAAVTHIATGTAAPVDYRAVPLIVYSRPEVAAVGLTEAQARQAGYEVATHSRGLQGVARAVIQGNTEGTVKLVTEAGGAVLGATVVGPQAGELIHELMYAVGWEALPAEAASFVHAHPTLAEAIGETLLAASGRGLH
jgi:dihydrolipoamide dehydrogenase